MMTVMMMIVCVLAKRRTHTQPAAVTDSQYTGLEVFEYLLLASCVRYHRDPHRLGFAAV